MVLAELSLLLGGATGLPDLSFLGRDPDPVQTKDRTLPPFSRILCGLKNRSEKNCWLPGCVCSDGEAVVRWLVPADAALQEHEPLHLPRPGHRSQGQVRHFIIFYSQVSLNKTLEFYAYRVQLSADLNKLLYIWYFWYFYSSFLFYMELYLLLPKCHFINLNCLDRQ